MKKQILLAVLAAFAASPAAAAGPYHAAIAPGAPGYSAQAAGPNAYTVTYTGDKGAKPDKVAQMALLRAAEMTVAAGQEWFAVLGSLNRSVALGDINDVRGRSGSVLGTGGTSAGSGGPRTDAPAGVGDAMVPGGPSIGGFGGGDVPYQVVERWRPRMVPQTSIVIQMGSGKQVNLKGLTEAPEFYSAKALVDDLRAKLRLK